MRLNGFTMKNYYMQVRCKLDILIPAKITPTSVLINFEFWSKRYLLSLINFGNDQPEKDYRVQQVIVIFDLRRTSFENYKSIDLLCDGRIAVKRFCDEEFVEKSSCFSRAMFHEMKLGG